CFFACSWLFSHLRQTCALPVVRIIATRVPGMTTGQAPCTEQTTPEQAMFFDGFLGIAGTGWVETTMTGHQRTDSVTVNLDQSEREITHWMTGVRNCWSGGICQRPCSAGATCPGTGHAALHCQARPDPCGPGRRYPDCPVRHGGV